MEPIQNDRAILKRLFMAYRTQGMRERVSKKASIYSMRLSSVMITISLVALIVNDDINKGSVYC